MDGVMIGGRIDKWMASHSRNDVGLCVINRIIYMGMILLHCS
jgi:hypothetical protein